MVDTYTAHNDALSFEMSALGSRAIPNTIPETYVPPGGRSRAVAMMDLFLIDLFILVTCTVAITYAMGMHIFFTVIVGCLEYLFLRALSPAAMVAAEEPLAEEKGEKIARATAKAAEAESTTRESTQDGSAPSGDAEASEANQAANKELVALQHKALASAVNGGFPVSDDALALRLLQGGSYTSSRAKRFLDLVRASYSRSATHDGRSWQRIDVSGAESVYNMRVIGKVLSDSERNSVEPPPPVNAAVVVEVCFRGSVFVGEEGGINLDNWCRVNLNPGLSKGKAGWLPELTPLDRQIGGASLFDNVQCHVHAGFQDAYIAARGPVMKWLDEQRRQHPDQRLHISCCGHSLGAALATLLALDLGSTGHDSVELVTWASPRVGDKAFCDAFAKHVPDVARFTCGADVVPRLPPEELRFEHVCPEMRLDAWVTSAMSVVTGEDSPHGIDAHAKNLENCFRDPLAVVRTSDGGWRLTNTYSSTALATILKPVAGWLSANDKLLERLDGVQDQLQLQLKALQDSVDSVSGCLLRSLQEQDIKLMIRQLRSEVTALMEGAKLRGEVLDYALHDLHVSQHNLLDVGKEIWSARDARLKHGPLMLDLLITSYSTELELLRRASRLEDVEERGRQIDQLVRSIFPAIEAALRSGSFSREQCPALDCLLPQLLIGRVLPLPQDQETTSPSSAPSLFPSAAPSSSPSTSLPSAAPSASPSTAPSSQPPSTAPSSQPSAAPSASPSTVPSSQPSAAPSASPSTAPSSQPSAAPSASPSTAPSSQPSAAPSASPSTAPSSQPSAAPSAWHLRFMRSILTKAPSATDAFWEKAGSSEVEVRRSAALKWTSKRLDAGDARIVAHLLASPVTAVLKTLDLCANYIGPEGAASIGKALKVNGVLKELNISRNHIGPTGAAAIADALKGNEVLTSLNLQNNFIRDRGAAAIAEALQGNGVLTELRLHNNEIGPIGAAAIADALKGNVVPKTLWLSGNNIGDEGAVAIADALRVNEVLTSLDVGLNGLTEEAALGIVRVERQRSKLTSLGLASCRIGPTGAAEIAEYVSGSEVLNNLDARSNDISGDAAQQLATAVLASSTLELFGSVPLKELRANALDQLDLSGDSLGVPEALVLAKLVEGSGVLAELNLGSNQLCGIDYFGRGTYSAAGITALAEALKVNGAVLTDLNLFNNNIRDEGAAAIAEALRGNEVLKYLDIRGNGLGAAGEGVIRAAVRGRCHGFELLLKM